MSQTFQQGSRSMKGPLDSIFWWEKRRIIFNLVVLAAGIVTLVLLELFIRFYAAPGEDLAPAPLLIVGVFVYGVAANIAYTLGWVTEILWSGGDTNRTETLRPQIYRLGLVLSVLVTLSPAALLPLLRLVIDSFG